AAGSAICPAAIAIASFGAFSRSTAIRSEAGALSGDLTGAGCEVTGQLCHPGQVDGPDRTASARRCRVEQPDHVRFHHPGPPAHGCRLLHAGYVSGRWPDIGTIRQRFPHARTLSIAIDAAHDADALDIETGDATTADAAAWYERQRARGVTRPCLYASADLMQRNVVPLIEASGIARSAVRLWSAHYSYKAHICGPASCRLM